MLSNLRRRDFLLALAAAPAVARAKRPGNGAPRPGTFVGIQMGPQTMLDEGIERTLDLIGEAAAVNAVMTYSHAFHGDLRKPARLLAPDHGITPRDNRRPRGEIAEITEENHQSFHGSLSRSKYMK